MPYRNALEEIMAERDGSRYREAVDEHVAQSRQLEAQNGMAAVSANPDQAAEAQRLASTARLPADVVERNLPEVRQRAALADYRTALERNPDLRTYFHDRDFAKVAVDDVEALGALQRVLQIGSRTGRSLAASYADVSASIAGGLQATSETAAAALDPLVRLRLLPVNPAASAAETFSGWRRGAESTAERIQGDISDAGFIERNVYGGFRSLGQNVGPLVGGALTRNPSVALGALGGIVFGSEYGEARDAGIEPGAAHVYAASQATIEYATEKLPVGLLFRDLQRAGLGRTIINQMAVEIPQEQIATVFQDLNAWAVLNPDKPFSAYLAERPSAAAATLISTIVATGGQTSVVYAIDRAAQRVAGDEQRATDARQYAERLAELNRHSAASKLRTRSPDRFRSFVESIAPDQSVYVDAAAFDSALAQSGVDPNTLPETIREQLADAALTDAPVRMTVAEFATTFAGQAGEAMIPHVRTSPDAMNLDEATSYGQSDFSATIGEEIEAGEPERARQESRNVVRDAVLEQLNLSERFTPAVNNAYAVLTSAFYEAQAARLGVTAAELYESMPLNIVAESPLGQAFQQAGEQRGAYEPDSRTIALLKNADLSTYLHESGHFFLEALAELAQRENAPAAFGDDIGKIMEWFGVPDLATWQGMTLEQRREHHEKFARGFEAYLFEGRAPSAELQTLFERFRSWMLSVYRQLRSLNVEINDDVRGVFDRMLATDSEIQAREALRAYEPIFGSAEQAGMTPEQFAEYQATGAEATAAATETLQRRTLRDMKWLSTAKGRELRRLQAEAAGTRKGIREEARQQVEAEPVYQALRFLQRGETTVDGEEIKATAGYKLSIGALQEMYPAGELGAVDWSPLRKPGRNSLVAKEGLHPNQVAEIFGFTSGDHLVRALLEAAPIADVIEARTDQMMLERHGDITDPAHLERAAEAAIANDARGRFLAREVAALAKAFGTWPAVARAANAYARQSIARKRIRDLRPAQYRNAEARASRESDRAFKAGDTAGAAMQKRNQLLANRMTRTAADAVDEVERALRYLRKFNVEASRAKIDPDYRDQIDALLERHDLRKSVTAAEIERRKSLLEWVESQRENGFEPEIDPALLSEARRTHYKDLTLESFRGLVDAVRNIEHLGRLKRRLLTAKHEREFAAAVDEAAASIESHATKEIADRIEHSGFVDGIKRGLKEFGAMHRKLASIIRQMDGVQDGGTMWELFVRPMNAAADTEASMRADATRKLHDLFKPLRAVGPLDWRSGLYIPAIGTSLTREARLAIALNWGNETNRRRVMEGDKWTPQQAEAILDTLTKAEWDFVQGVWDFVDSYWPAIAAKQKRVSGTEPQKVEAVTVQTKYGELRGGYYPIKYDPLRSSKADADTASEAIKQTMQGLYTRATTRRGHTKARVDTVERPLRKDLGVLLEHVEQITHDLAYHEYLIDATRLLRAAPIDAAIRAHYGPEVLRMMRDTLDDVAKGDISAANRFERAINHVRTGSTIAALGWNLSTALLQPLGLSQSIVRIGPKWVARGLAQWLGDAAHMENTAKAIAEKSDFMRLRAQTLQREIRELQGQIRNRRLNAIQSSYFYLIQKFQLVADIPTWLGAYEKSLEAGNDDARAIALADQAVMDSQGGGALKDLSAIQRGGPLLKLFTQFYSFFNTTYNLGAESIARTKFNDPLAVGRLAADFLLLLTVPAVLGMMLRETLRGDDDDDSLVEKIIREQIGFTMNLLVGVREFSSAAQGYSYEGPTGGRAFAEGSKLVQQLEQGEADAAMWKTLNQVGGILFHYPAGQVERTVRGIIAVSEDEAPPQAVVLGPPRE